MAGKIDRMIAHMVYQHIQCLTAFLPWSERELEKPWDARDIIFVVDLLVLKPTNILALGYYNFRHNKHLDSQKALIRHFIREAIQMANKHMKNAQDHLSLKEWKLNQILSLILKCARWSMELILDNQ